MRPENQSASGNKTTHCSSLSQRTPSGLPVSHPIMQLQTYCLDDTIV